MKITDNISSNELIKIGLNKEKPIKEILFLYVIATGDLDLYLQLVRKGLITTKLLFEYVKEGYIINNTTAELPVITKKTIQLFTNINFQSNITKAQDVINPDAVKQEIERNNVEKWIDEFRNLFKGKKPGAIGDKNLCIIRMKEFVNSNPEFTKEHILKATKRYVEDRQEQNYMYLKRAHYFISKQETKDGKKVEISDLLTYCEELPMKQIDDLSDSTWFGGLKIG